MNKFVVIMIGAMLIVIAFTFQYLYDKRPSVASSWAIDNETTHVLADKVWEATFTEEMDEQTINKDTVYVVNNKGEKLDLSISLSKDKKTIRINPPEGGYDPNVDYYTLYVKAALKSVGGRTLRASKNVSFSVSEKLPVLNSKEQLQAYFKDILQREKESRKRMEKFSFSGSTEESSEAAMDSSMAKGESQSSTSNEFTDTNVQVQGVDEADIVKTDGTYIYQVIDRKLKISKAVPATNIEMVSTIPYQKFEPFQLFIDGNKLVVMGNSYNEFSNHSTSADKMILPMFQQTKVIVYDITDKSNPKEVKTVEIEGNYVTSRKIGSTIYLINNHYPDYWRLEDKKNVDLRPRFTDSSVSEETQFINYKDIRYFPESREATYSIIATFDIEKLRMR
jgi:inhibitor of cysteine peptidase